jgi:hypothetical protein
MTNHQGGNQMEINATTLAKALAEAQKPFADQFSRIEVSLRALACAELARTLYSADELRSQRERMRNLSRADADAFEALNKAHDELTGMSWDERIRKFGMADAEAQRAPAEKARVRRAGTLEALDAFKEEHPIVYELVQLAKSRAAS